MKKQIKMDGAIYLRLKPIVEKMTKVKVIWHPESQWATVTGDILLHTNELTESGDLAHNEVELVYEMMKPENSRLWQEAQ